MSSPRPPKDRRVRTATVHASRRRLHLAAMVLALLLITALAASANAPPDIDTFANPASAAVYTVTAGNTSFSSMQSPSTGVDILGDWRDVYVYSVAGNSVNLEVGNTKFRHSQNSGGTARTVLTYDGNGGGYGGAGTIYNGLGGKDLTYGGTRNGFRFRIVSLDWTTDVRIKVYDNANSGKYSEKTFSGLFPGNSTNADIVVEFAAIPQGSGATGPATFSSVGAIEFEFIGSHIDTDLTLDSIDTTILDWGDLPQDGSGCSNYPYATRLACDGPRHLVSSGLYLGASIDPSASSAGELDGQPSAVADGDDVHHGDDENGVVPQAASGKGSCEYWNSATNGGKLRFTGTGIGRLVGWVDFDGDGFEAAETVVNQLVSGAPWSPIDIEFNIPSGVFSGQCEASLYARFRLFPPDDESSLNDLRAPYAFDGRDKFGVFAPPLTPPGRATDGEVEDYYWHFGPTAVELTSLTATIQEAGIEIGWDTANEADNLGFNVYRSTAPDEPGVRLNPSLIPVQEPGSPVGQHYSYLDNAGLVSGTTYSYWVEDVSASGAATRHEPISVLYTGSSTGPNAIRVARFGAAAAPAGLPAAGLLLGGVAAGTGAWLRRRRRAA